MNCDAGTIDINRMNVESRFLVVFAQAVDQVVASRNALCKWIFPDRLKRIAVQFGGGLREVNEGLHQHALGFIDLIKHWVNLCVVQGK